MGPTGRFAPSAPGHVLPSHRDDDSKDGSDVLFSTSSRSDHENEVAADRPQSIQRRAAADRNFGGIARFGLP
jgi:hypothetical protein